MLQNVQKILSLPFCKKAILLETSLWLLFISTYLKFSNFNKTDKFFNSSKLVRWNKKPAGKKSLDDIIWAINVLGNKVPGATCLSNAITAKTMLGRQGFEAVIHIGIKKNSGKVIGHAWVEFNGEIILGGKNSPSSFIPISHNKALFNKLCSGIK